MPRFSVGVVLGLALWTGAAWPAPCQAQTFWDWLVWGRWGPPTVAGYAPRGDGCSPCGNACSPCQATTACSPCQQTAACAPCQVGCAPTTALRPIWQPGYVSPYQFRTTLLPTQVTYYRPALALDPIFGRHVANYQPCTSTVFQTQRVPVSDGCCPTQGCAPAASCCPTNACNACPTYPTCPTCPTTALSPTSSCDGCGVGAATSLYAPTASPLGWGTTTLSAPSGCSTCNTSAQVQTVPQYLQPAPAQTQPLFQQAPGLQTAPRLDSPAVTTPLAPADQAPTLNQGQTQPQFQWPTQQGLHKPDPGPRKQPPAQVVSETAPRAASDAWRLDIQPVPDPDAALRQQRQEPRPPLLLKPDDRTASFPVKQAGETREAGVTKAARPTQKAPALNVPVSWTAPSAAADAPDGVAAPELTGPQLDAPRLAPPALLAPKPALAAPARAPASDFDEGGWRSAQK